MKYKTTPAQLNFRRSPKVTAGNIMAALPQGQTVEKTADAGNGWWLVKTLLGGTSQEGYVASAYLERLEEPAVTAAPATGPAHALPPVHLKEGDASVKRSNTRRAFPLGEPGMPRRNPADPEAEKSAALGQIIRYLDVEKSARYAPDTRSTYCNIYAYDYAYLGGAYIPRVWWTSKAIVDLRAGKSVAAQYGATVSELNANSLYNWLEDYGAEFGWKRVFDAHEIQEAANGGGIGIICAIRKNLNEPGHICAVVPETATYTAVRTAGKVGVPLQSQAGRTNKKYFSQNWWTSANFRQSGFWIHD